jgi:hypothetical protein
VLLCDASGAVAAVEIDGGERRSVHAKDGLLLEGGAGVDVAGRLRAAAPGEVASLAAALGDRIAVLDPRARRIGLLSRGARAQWWRPSDPVPEDG